jgi:hypothetical protein
MKRRGRIVEVNTARRGLYHDPKCLWLAGAINSGSHATYVSMREPDAIALGKRQCSHCASVKP